MHPDIEKFKRSPRDNARWRKAQEKLLHGYNASALVDYRDLVKRFPGVPELWFELGNAASGHLDFPLANRAYARARELAPDNAKLLNLIAQQYQALRQLDDARFCYERAVAAAPASVDARINLAVWLEKDRRLEEAWDQVEACLARHPRDDQARYFRAFLLHRRKENAQAESELRALVADGPRYPYVQYASRHLLGVVLDALGQYGEAMECLLESKAVVRTLVDTAALEEGYDANEVQRKRLLESLTAGHIGRWRAAAAPKGEVYRHAFLGGHPRSGTTLLEQVLDAHPDVLAFDEPAGFGLEVAPLFARQAAEGPDPLAAYDRLPARKIADLRARYTRSLLREAPAGSPARLLLDKNPSPTEMLPIWLRVFPELRVIIALRDPRDVLVSCFFLSIMLNATNVNFLSMERTATHYANLMGAWLRMRELGGFDWIESRYEDVVGGLETEGRRVTEFLGLDWHPDQARFHETARRKVVFAPTYHDVTRTVYSSAIGRWNHYAKALEPVMERIAPFCQAFGYSV